MARLENLRKGGYFPVLMELVSSLAALVQLQPGKAHYVCDPCAGAGEGIEGLIGCWTSKVRGMDDTKVTPLLCELEKSRYDLLMGRVNNALSPIYNNAAHYHKHQYIHGDAFKVGWKEDFDGVSAMWLNPPYADDNDGFKIDKDDKKAVAHRLEEEFLQHFHNLIAIGGALMFFVPYHALKWSAATIARHFEDVSCYRMPEPIFTDYYKQVLLIARKRPALHQPDPLLQSMIEEWAADSNCIPVLPINGVDSSGTRVDPMLVTSDSDGRWGPRVENAGWKILPFNVGAVLRTAKLWYAPSRGGELQPIEAVIPGGSFKDLFARQYPLAMPPRATHIGAAISAGVMGGVRLVPNDKPESAHLPVLYIGGHFEKAFKTVEERTNKDGEVSSILQIEQPILKITVLDTRAATYITLKNEVAESDATDVKDFTAGDLLKHYGDSMVTELKKRCPALYDPSDPNENMFPIAWPADRQPFEAQEHAIRALVKMLQQGPDHSAIFIGSVGSGKCLKLHTKVMMHDGTLRNVEDVKTGDLLMGPDSRPRTVMSTTRGTGSLYKIDPVKGEPWFCNDAHILSLVHTSTGEVIDVNAKLYAESPRLEYRVPGCGPTTYAVEFKQFFPENGVEFPPQKRPLPVDPYFLGVWLGDGTKGQNHLGIKNIQVTKPDPEIRALMEDTAREWGLECHQDKSNREGECPSFRIVRGKEHSAQNTLLHVMREVVGDGTAISHEYLTASKENRRALLAGFLDTDGYTNNGYIEIAQKNRGYADGIRFLCHSLGLCSTMVPKVVNGETYWRIALSGDLNSLPMRIPRKKVGPRATERTLRKGSDRKVKMSNVARTGIKVTPAGIGEYAGFELDGDGRFLLGDFTVTHNSNVSLMTAQTVFDTSRRIGADHILVMAPPHLGSTWKTQVEASWPGARAIMLETTVDMDDFVRHQNGRVFVSGRPSGSKLDGHSGPVVGVLSRETAKLGHRHVGIRNGAWKGERAAKLLEGQDQLLETGYCPKCGTPVYDAPDDLAKRRARCKAKFKRGANRWAEWVRRIAVALVPVVPGNAEVSEKLTGRGEQLFLARRRVIQAERKAASLPLFTTEECTRSQRILGNLAIEMAPAMVKMSSGFYTKAKEPHPMRAFVRLMLGAGNDAAIYNAVFAFWQEAKRQSTEDYSRRQMFDLAKSMLVLLADDAIYAEAKATLEKDEPTTSSANYYGNHQNSWKEIEANRKRIWHPGQDTDSNGWNVSIGAESITFDSATKQPRIDNHQFRSVNLAITAIRELSGVATYIEDTDACGEALYQAYARPLGKGTLADDECDKVAPRRIALATYFSKRLKKHLKRGKWMLITDEVHELANNEDSAQSKAAQQLWNLKMPTIAMTGSIMNGYPSSIFILLWSLSSDFRKEFGRGESARYSKTYGYQKQLIVIEKGTSKVKEFGAFSDKTEDDSKRAKNAGFSPGMLPASTLKHALRKSVTLQLRDIAKSLPPCHFKVERIEPTKEQGERAVSLLTRIHDQIKKDRFTKDSGKLMGALTEAPSFLDRCIEGVGNQEDGSWVSAYPDDRIVWQFPGFSADSRLPKEKWLLNYLDNQLAAGRDVIVLAWHLNLLPRLRTIIEKDLHVLAPILYSDKVAPKNREAWIQKELDGKGARVFLCNPVSISTGLNALTRFNSIVHFENPACNPFVYRQSNGRIVRIGQKQAQEIVFPLYAVDGNSKVNTQGIMHRLLLHKVGVSEGIEGLDPAAALQAAGVGDQDSLAGRDIGRLLSSMLDGDSSGLRLLQREFIDRLSVTTDDATKCAAVV